MIRRNMVSDGLSVRHPLCIGEWIQFQHLKCRRISGVLMGLLELCHLVQYYTKYRCPKILWRNYVYVDSTVPTDGVAPLGAGTSAYLPRYPGYFREPHWKSMGLPEISRVTWHFCVCRLMFNDKIMGPNWKEHNQLLLPEQISFWGDPVITLVVIDRRERSSPFS